MYILLFAALSALTSADQDFSQYVNVFSGTQNGGNMLPGVVAEPFAAVKLSPDFQYATAEAYVGYLPDVNASLTGFSMMHESGIGGAAKYGVVSQMPVSGAVANPLVDLSSKRAQPDQGSVGYFKSSLQNGVVAELAATSHSGLMQYTFPAGQSSSIVVDVSHVLPSHRGTNWGQLYDGGSLTIAADGHYEGSGSYSKGWNLAPDWTIYFCGKFDQTPSSAKTFIGHGQTVTAYGQDPTVTGTDRLGGVFTFDNVTQVISRVGISWISTQRACQYLDNEIPAGTTLTTLVDNSKTKWNAEVFNKITTVGADNDSLTLLYTSLYGMHLLPSNRTGDNPGWQSAEPYYDDIFTFWDLFRCTTPLFHVLQPMAYEELLRSIIDVWRHEGWLPDARSSNFNGRTQGGSSADNILADAYVKGLRGAINWDDAYAAMQTDAEKTPPNNNDPSARDSSTAQGRGALPDWLNYGYITPTYTRAVTRGVEYSANDFGLRQVALGLNKTADALKYVRRSRQWRNHFNPQAQSLGSTGFLVPRLADGSFVQQNPLDCNGCYWSAPYYEGKPWEYTMNAHHDMAKLIELGGGSDAFVGRLNTLMDPANKIFNPGNEPSFTTPMLYNFVGRQDLAVQQSRRVAKTNYNAGLGGIPGASDAGAMQSWILWNMIGLYPITGQTTFLIGSPWFDQMVIQTPSGKPLTITSTGGNSDTAFYVQSLQVNGKPWTQNWLTWNDIFDNGGAMDFVLGPNPTNWDTGALPPSPATGKQGAMDTGTPLKSNTNNQTVPASPKLIPFRKPLHKDTRVRTAIVVVSVVGFFAIVSGVLAFLWFKKIGVFGRKRAQPDTESTSNDVETKPAAQLEGSGDKPEVIEVHSDAMTREEDPKIAEINDKRTPVTIAEVHNETRKKMNFWKKKKEDSA